MTTTPNQWLDEVELPHLTGSGSGGGTTLAQLESGLLLRVCYDTNPLTPSTLDLIDPLGRAVASGDISSYGIVIPAEAAPTVTALPGDRVLFSYAQDDGIGGNDLSFSSQLFDPVIRGFRLASEGKLLDDSAIRGHVESHSDFMSVGNSKAVFTYATERTGNEHSIFVKRFNLDTGGMTQPNLVTKVSGAEAIEVASIRLETPQGEFATAWTEHHTGDDAIRFRIHDFAGNTLVSRTVVSKAEFSDVEIDALADGGFVLNWTVTDPVSSDSQARYRVYNADGSARSGSAKSAGFDGPGSDFLGEVVALQDGGFLLAWRHSNLPSEDPATYTRHYDAQGVALGDAFLVHDQVHEHGPAIAMIELADGRVGLTDDVNPADFKYFTKFDILDTRDAPVPASEVDGIQYLLGTGGGDFLVASAIEGLVVDASFGDDDITDAAGSQTIYCGQGFDVLHAVSKVGPDNDAYIGGTGNGAGDSTDYLNMLDFSAVNQRHLEIDLQSGQRVTDTSTGLFISVKGFGSAFGTRHSDVIKAGSFGSAFGGDGNDELSASTGSGHVLAGEGGDDLLWGGVGGEAFEGGDGEDTVDYSLAPDFIWANLGTDPGNTLGYAFGDTYLSIEHAVGSGFDDTITGGGATVHIEGGNGNDKLAGAVNSELLEGDDGDDLILGGGGNDELSGSGGDDELNGGAGADRLRGSSGADVFVVSNSAESSPGVERDTIEDFRRSSDLVDLSAINVKAGTSLQFNGEGTFSLTDNDLFYFFDGSGNTVVVGDIDGNGLAEFEILLIGEIALNEAHFIL